MGGIYCDIGNSSGMGFYCVARNEEHAKQIALKHKHVKSVKNAKVHLLQPDEQIQKLIDSQQWGHIIYKLSGSTDLASLIAGGTQTWTAMVIPE